MLSGKSSRHLLTCFTIARSCDEAGTRADIFRHLFWRLAGRAYKLKAPSYEEVAKCAPTTDYRPPTTKNKK